MPSSYHGFSSQTAKILPSIFIRFTIFFEQTVHLKNGNCFIDGVNVENIFGNLTPRVYFFIHHNKLPPCDPYGQKLIFLQGSHCYSCLCPCKYGQKTEDREYVALQFPLNSRHPNRCTCTPHYKLITLLCSLWLSTDKQCDDQRPLIALRR